VDETIEDGVSEGRIDGQTRRTLSNPPSYRARAYLYYLALRGHLRIDYDWLLAVGDLCIHDVVQHMSIDLGIEILAREGAGLGPRLTTSDSAMRWTLGRLAMHHGTRSADQIGDPDVDGLLCAIRRFGERSDLADYWGSIERYGVVSKHWITMVSQLRMVLYHRGQAHEVSRKIMPSCAVPAQQPEMVALVDWWLQRRAPALRPSTVYHHALTARRFLQHLGAVAPEVQTFATVKHDHVVSRTDATATERSPKTGRPLTIQSQRGHVVRLAQFFKDAEDWAWPGIPRWPLVAKRDLPRAPECVPRYIPRADLERLMTAVRSLDDSFQRAAFLVARWSGARRSEIQRLTTDCLDTYPDGTARLRLPVGKTARERLVPLHEEAAEALRAVLAIRADVADRDLPDERTGRWSGSYSFGAGSS